MTGEAFVYLVIAVLGAGVLITMPIWAGWWRPKLPQFRKNQGQRRGKRRFLR